MWGPPAPALELGAPAGFPFESLALPGPLVPAEVGWHLLAPLAEGHVLPVASEFQSRALFSDNGMTLPMVALLQGRRAERGALVVFISRRWDHGVEVRRTGASSPNVELVRLASLGHWRDQRRWRLVWVGERALLAVAAAARRELRAAGALRLRSVPRRTSAIGAATSRPWRARWPRSPGRGAS